jgi:hypothetical protein
MAGGHELRAQLPRLAQQGGELHMLVAPDARIRRPSPAIFTAEVIDYLPRKQLSAVNRMMRYPQLLRDHSRHPDIIARTIGRLYANRHPDDLVTLLFKQCGSHR